MEQVADSGFCDFADFGVWVFVGFQEGEIDLLVLDGFVHVDFEPDYLLFLHQLLLFPINLILLLHFALLTHILFSHRLFFPDYIELWLTGSFQLDVFDGDFWVSGFGSGGSRMQGKVGGRRLVFGEKFGTQKVVLGFHG